MHEGRVAVVTGFSSRLLAHLEGNPGSGALGLASLAERVPRRGPDSVVTVDRPADANAVLDGPAPATDLDRLDHRRVSLIVV